MRLGYEEYDDGNFRRIYGEGEIGPHTMMVRDRRGKLLAVYKGAQVKAALVGVKKLNRVDESPD